MLIQADARKIPLADRSVNCCVTSPPYWGLRDYGMPGQIGLERTPEEYIAAMLDAFNEVKRVLRDDGTLWLNMGDSYAGSAQGWGHDKQYAGPKQSTNRGSLNQPGRIDETVGFQRPPNYISSRQPNGIKPKDLVGIPWMLAFALRADGWYLRSDIIWSKPNPMPESVMDRPTKAHEYIFLLSKSEKYYYDGEAIKEFAISGDPRKPYAPGQVDDRGNGHDRGGGKVRESVKRGGFNGKTNAMPGREAFRAIEDWRNKRSVWEVTTQCFPEAHFATFPEELIKPCILAGCPQGGTVLDPFMGSGTTALVARNLQCNAVGLELNAAYIEIAKRRLSQEVLDFDSQELPEMSK